MSTKRQGISFLFFLFIYELVSINKVTCYPIFPTILTVSIPIYEKDQKMNDVYSQSRVENNYFRWLQASGADIVVVHPWSTYDQIDFLLEEKVNGVLFQGNPSPINKSSSYYAVIKHIFTKVIELNDKGVKMPILAIGDDASLVATIIANDDDSIVTTPQIKIKTGGNLKFYLSIDKTLILSEFTQEDAKIFEEENVLPNNLDYYIKINSFISNYQLSNFFKVIATSIDTDNDNKEYVAIAEGKKYPISLVTFHPEYVSFEQNSELIVPECLSAVFMARFMGNSFVFFGRKYVKNEFTVEEKRKYDYIEPYGEFPKLIDGRFNYLFKNTQ